MHTLLADNDLFESATGALLPKDAQSKPSEYLLPLEAASRKIDEFVNTLIPSFVNLLVEYERVRERAQRVDGRIIGTGEADFTKGNTVYTLNHKGKVFQLIDVPGIEGDEGKYVTMVHQAVAKAHMVFYVNGTNKKPEKATAEKIRQFLRRGTQVCPIINIRGSADAYEFEEDRTSLEAHGGVTAALKQTTDVLNAVLGQEVLLPGLCAQGLLAFSSLAINAKTHHTTIHPSRNKDLVVQQRNFLKHFSSSKAMFEFSQIRTVAKMLHAKLGTFKEDIVESNKAKVRELLKENATVLQKALDEHRKFITRIEPEFEKCRDSISAATESFERLISAGRKNLWSEFFNNLSAAADKIVAQNFGDNDLITSKINKAFKNRQGTMAKKLQAQLEEHTETLQQNVRQAMERLIQDIKRVEFSENARLGFDNANAVYRAVDLDMGLGLKGWGSIAFNIGSYVLAGAPFGPIGIAIGAVAGVLVSVLNFFTSKESRIRKAQAQVQSKIDEVRNQVMRGLPDETKKLMAPIHKEIKEAMLSRVDTIFTTLTYPITIIEKQIALMTQMQTQLENMPYGTIHAIQR